MIACWRAVAVGLFGILSVLPREARADGTQWDWLAGTQWYVPAANLLAYFTSGTDLTNNVAVADQTLWNITASSGGVFSGTTQATFSAAGQSIVSNSTMTGIATPGGQVRMVFTSEGTGATTVGIGQFRDLGLPTEQIEMQMMTMAGSAYVTHWAYMTEVPGAGFSPPTSIPPGTLLSQEWKWTEGTTWSMTAPGVFGTSAPGQFTISAYVNGYFWGTGVGPASAGSPAFTHIASITPEGNVLFNLLLDGSLVNLTGQIAGDVTNGTMLLRGYTGTESFGDVANATVVPEPSVIILLSGVGLFWLVALRRRR